MDESLKNRNLNEKKHWKDLGGDVDKYWLHHTPVGQARIRHRSKLIADFVGRNKSSKVLEIGAGNGWYSLPFAQFGWNLTVTDLSPDLLKIAKKKVGMKYKKVKFEVADAYNLPYKENSFDAIIGSSILHHIDLDSALPEMHRVLKHGGKIAFCEPNMLNPQIALQKNIPYLKRLVGDSPDETAYFRWQISKNLAKFNFIRITAYPIDFLHPKTPAGFLPFVESLSRKLEKIPAVKEIAGSLFIGAVKP